MKKNEKMELTLDNMYSADFETTLNPGGTATRVWLFDICPLEPKEDGTYTHIQGVNIASFVKFTIKNPGTYYFHNLAFDGSYIVDFLERTGWKNVESVYTSKEQKVYSVLVTEMGQWHMILIKRYGFKSIVTIRDSLKKIPLSVKKIAKAYNLPIAKGEIDYTLCRWDGMYKPTEEEKEYVKIDTEIVARALKIHFDEGMKTGTIAGDALAEFKATLDARKQDEWKQKIICDDYYNNNPDDEFNIRLSYCGGISWVNPSIKTFYLDGERYTPICENGATYDYNSMYPSVMLMYPMPLGVPHKDTEWKDKPLWVARAHVKAKRKHGKPACMRHPERKVWVESTEEWEELTLTVTNIDYEIINKCYMVEWEFEETGYWWEGEKGIFDDYINHWSLVKRTSKGGKRQIAKLMLNSLYGKFGSNPHRAHKIPVYDIDSRTIHWTMSESVQVNVYNVAISSFITAYARRELVNAILDIDGIFCYCDTDSIHFCGENKKFRGRVHDTDFGAWKKESEWKRAKFLRQKTYCEEIIKEDGTTYLDVKACGCNDEAKKFITFDSFELGLKVPGKKMKRTIEGGAIIQDGYFTVHAPVKTF